MGPGGHGYNRSMSEEVDDRYARRHVTLDPEADALLEALHQESGKDYSEVVRLGLASLRGDKRLIRHALSQPLSGLRIKLNLLTAVCAREDPGTLELIEGMHAEFRRVETILAPPVIPPASPATPAV